MEAAGIEPANDSDRSFGVIYAIEDEQRRIKIGWARNASRRLAILQTGNADELRLVGVIPGTVANERIIHELLVTDRLRGEWYRDSPDLRELFS